MAVASTCAKLILSHCRGAERRRTHVSALHRQVKKRRSEKRRDTVFVCEHESTAHGSDYCHVSMLTFYQPVVEHLLCVTLWCDGGQHVRGARHWVLRCQTEDTKEVVGSWWRTSDNPLHCRVTSDQRRPLSDRELLPRRNTHGLQNAFVPQAIRVFHSLVKEEVVEEVVEVVEEVAMVAGRLVWVLGVVLELATPPGSWVSAVLAPCPLYPRTPSFHHISGRR